jgi:hypothetical protein
LKLQNRGYTVLDNLQFADNPVRMLLMNIGLRIAKGAKRLLGGSLIYPLSGKLSVHVIENPNVAGLFEHGEREFVWGEP